MGQYASIFNFFGFILAFHSPLLYCRNLKWLLKVEVYLNIKYRKINAALLKKKKLYYLLPPLHSLVSAGLLHCCLSV